MQTPSTLGSYIVNGRRHSSRFCGATSSASSPSSSPLRSSRSTPPSTPPKDAGVNMGVKRKRAKSEGDQDERPCKKQDQKKESPQKKGEEQEKEEQTDRTVEESVVPEEEHEQPSTQMAALLPSPVITEREAEPEGLSEPIYVPAEVDERTLAHAYDTDDEHREEKEIQTLKLNSVKWDRVLENYKADEREEDSDDDEVYVEAKIPFRRSPAPEPRTPPPQAASTPGTVPSAPWRPTTTRPPRGLVRRSPTPPTEAGSLRRTYQLDPKTMREMEPEYKSRYQYRWSARYNPYDAAWDDADDL